MEGKLSVTFKESKFTLIYIKLILMPWKSKCSYINRTVKVTTEGFGRAIQKRLLINFIMSLSMYVVCVKLVKVFSSQGNRKKKRELQKLRDLVNKQLY